MSISVIGAGAFGTALAVTLANDGHSVTLYARSAEAVAAMDANRSNPRLPDVSLPKAMSFTNDFVEAAHADVILLAVPTQTLVGVITANAQLLANKSLVACCKGIDIGTLSGPVAAISSAIPTATAAMLTGPSFAADIARGLPTALTLACTDAEKGQDLQQLLSTKTLRLYRTTDTIGAELGGALKNVIAVSCGVAIGAGLGESARAALMTRGFAEMQRLAAKRGAQPDTLAGLSGFGDLALTCTSRQSRNYRFGLALGKGEAFDPSQTVEGAATAKALSKLSHEMGIDLPICGIVAKLVNAETNVETALADLMSRPLKEE